MPPPEPSPRAASLESTSVELLHRRRARALGAALTGTYFGGLVLALSGAAAVYWAFLAPIGLLFAWWLATRPRTGPATVRADERGVTVQFEQGRPVTLARGQLVSGLLLPARLGAVAQRVEITAKGGRVVRAEVATERAGEALLAAAGLDASQRRYTASSPSWVRMALLAAMNTVLAAVAACPLAWIVTVPIPRAAGDWFGLAYSAFFLVSTAALTWSARRTVVEVGLDGVLIRRPWAKHYVRYRDLRAIDYDGFVLRFVRRADGFTTSVDLRDTGLDEDHRAALFARVRASATGAGVRSPGLDGEPMLAGVLARQGRSVSAWRAALGALLERAAGYRDGAHVDRETLVRVVGDAGARVEHRVAAALALTARGAESDPRARETVRVAAAACASEPVRVALERAAAGALDEDTLERAVRVEEEAERSGRG